MEALMNYAKGILAGIGGVAPGLSGSVLLVIMGLYEKTVNAIGTLFKNFKKNLAFLIPLVLGIGTGVLLFSKIVDSLLTNYEFQTRYLFLGLVVGTLPLLYKEVKKNGYSAKYYLFMAAAFAVGVAIFWMNPNLFPKAESANVAQSLVLGVAYAGSALIPGVDSAAILSALGMYDLWVKSVADLNFSVLIPAAVGLGVGALVISAFMNFLLKRFYTATFSVIFGLFLTVIPSVVQTEGCKLTGAGSVIAAIIWAVVGFAASYYFGDIPGNNAKIKKLLSSKK